MRYVGAVSDPVREITQVVGLVDGLILVKRERVWSDGAKLGGDFVCEPHVAGWLADQVVLAADDALFEAELHAAPDHLVVFVGGGEHGAPTNINVHNRRDHSAPSYGGTVSLSGMSASTARQLAKDLRAYTAKTRAPLTDEDRELAAKWRADREKRANEGPSPRKLPADSPIFKKWDSDPFPGGPDFAESGPQVPNADAETELRDEQKDIEFFLDRLINGDARDRAVSLNSLAGRPRADERLLAACERLLEDRTIALLSIPYKFGEIRWVAADAVAAMRALMGRTETVVIEDVFAPVSSGNVDKLAIEAGVPPSTKGGIEGDIETLERVAAAGKLPRRRITREPWMPPQS